MLKTSGWAASYNMKGIRLETFKELLKNYIPGIGVKLGVIEEDTDSLFINWNQISLSLKDDAIPLPKEKIFPFLTGY